jgi:hypothetical protein
VPQAKQSQHSCAHGVTAYAVDPVIQVVNAKQSDKVVLLQQVLPIPKQHIQVQLPQEHVSTPQASLFLDSYCSEDFHIPDGTVLSHTVSLHEQQTLQQGQAQ